MNDNFYNLDYEKAILGCMLLNNELIDDIKSKLSSDCFFNAKAKLIYETIVSQFTNDGCSDLLTLTTALPKISPSELATLTDTVPSTANWELYVNKVKSLYISRKMQKEIAATMEGLTGDNSSDIITDLNSKLSSYMQSEGCKSISAKNLCVDMTQKVYDAYQNMKEGNILLGYDTGMSQLNEITDGFQSDKFYVIGARPSIGKTAFGLNLISQFCKRKIPTAMFSLEMTSAELFYRFAAMDSGLPIDHIKKGFCFSSKIGMGKFQNSMKRIFEYPLSIYDTADGSDIDKDSTLYAKIRYEAKINKAKIILIDHLGLIECTNSTGQRYVDVGKITKTLHKMAKELHICLILLSQCGREAEGKEPSLALLRESGNIEQDGDIIILLHREREMNELNVPTNIIVAKNRDGKIGKANMIFQLQFCKFVDADAEGHVMQSPPEPVIIHKKENKEEVENALF